MGGWAERRGLAHQAPAGNAASHEVESRRRCRPPWLRLAGCFTRWSDMFLKRILILLLSLAMLPGCMTRQLWRDELPQYDETVSSVLIAKDQQHVVFIGQRYHYVFQDMPGCPN